MTQQTLIDQLKSKTLKTKQHVEHLAHLPSDTLHQQPSMGGWSIAANLHHLNLYGDFYLPAFRKAIENGKAAKSPNQPYKEGLLGGYFAKSMLPKEGKVKNKMKTFADKNPDNVGLPANTLETFIRQQEEMLALLDAAKGVDLKKNKVSITIAKWIKLRLGDTFHFVINHNERHMVQIDAVLEDVGESDLAEVEG